VSLAFCCPLVTEVSCTHLDEKARPNNSSATKGDRGFSHIFKFINRKQLKPSWRIETSRMWRRFAPARLRLVSNANNMPLTESSKSLFLGWQALHVLP
jgi:hypothetical protein